LDFLANHFLNANGVRNLFAVRNANVVATSFGFLNALIAGAANLLAAGFALVGRAANFFAAGFAAGFADIDRTAAGFAAGFANVNRTGTAFWLANGYAVGVLFWNFAAFNNAARNLFADDVWAPNFFANRAVASLWAWITARITACIAA
jgi:hypothetical protein